VPQFILKRDFAVMLCLTTNVGVDFGANLLRLEQTLPILRRKDGMNNQMRERLCHVDKTTYYRVVCKPIWPPFQGGFLWRA
jgi:hypothetical protein